MLSTFNQAIQLTGIIFSTLCVEGQVLVSIGAPEECRVLHAQQEDTEEAAHLAGAVVLVVTRETNGEAAIGAEVGAPQEVQRCFQHMAITDLQLAARLCATDLGTQFLQDAPWARMQQAPVQNSHTVFFPNHSATLLHLLYSSWPYCIETFIQMLTRQNTQTDAKIHDLLRLNL